MDKQQLLGLINEVHMKMTNTVVLGAISRIPFSLKLRGGAASANNSLQAPSSKSFYIIFLFHWIDLYCWSHLWLFGVIITINKYCFLDRTDLYSV